MYSRGIEWAPKKVGKISNSEIKEMKDLNIVEVYIFTFLVFLTIFFGVYPEPLLSTIDISVNNLIDAYKANLDFYLTNGQN